MPHLFIIIINIIFKADLLFSLKHFIHAHLLWCYIVKYSFCNANLSVIKCIAPWGHITLFCISSSWFVSFLARTGFQHHNMKWCWQCTSLFFPSLATILDGLYLKSIYCTKNERGGKKRGEKTVCAIKKYQQKKKSSFTPAIGTHPHITSMIYINS